MYFFIDSRQLGGVGWIPLKCSLPATESRMKQYILVLLLLFGVVVSAQADECVNCNTLRISGNAEYPPLTWQDKQDPTKLIGFAIELLKMAFSDLDIEVKGVYAGPWKRAQKAIQQGEIDVLGGAYITEARKRFMDYVQPPFVIDPTVIFVRKGEPFHFQSWQDLIGLTGGAPTGNSFGEAFDQFEEEHLDIERVTRISQAFKKLISRRSDYVVYGLYPGLAELELIESGDKIGYLPTSVIEEGLYFTFSKQSPCNCKRMKTHLSQKIQSFAAQQLPQKLIRKYLSIWKQQSKL